MDNPPATAEVPSGQEMANMTILPSDLIGELKQIATDLQFVRSETVNPNTGRYHYTIPNEESLHPLNYLHLFPPLINKYVKPSIARIFTKLRKEYREVYSKLVIAHPLESEGQPYLHNQYHTGTLLRMGLKPEQIYYYQPHPALMPTDGTQYPMQVKKWKDDETPGHYQCGKWLGKDKRKFPYPYPGEKPFHKPWLLFDPHQTTGTTRSQGPTPPTSTPSNKSSAKDQGNRAKKKAKRSIQLNPATTESPGTMPSALQKPVLFEIQIEGEPSQRFFAEVVTYSTDKVEMANIILKHLMWYIPASRPPMWYVLEHPQLSRFAGKPVPLTLPKRPETAAATFGLRVNRPEVIPCLSPQAKKRYHDWFRLPWKIELRGAQEELYSTFFQRHLVISSGNSTPILIVANMHHADRIGRYIFWVEQDPKRHDLLYCIADILDAINDPYSMYYIREKILHLSTRIPRPTHDRARGPEQLRWNALNALTKPPVSSSSTSPAPEQVNQIVQDNIARTQPPAPSYTFGIPDAECTRAIQTVPGRVFDHTPRTLFLGNANWSLEIDQLYTLEHNALATMKVHNMAEAQRLTHMATAQQESIQVRSRKHATGPRSETLGQIGNYMLRLHVFSSAHVAAPYHEAEVALDKDPLLNVDPAIWSNQCRFDNLQHLIAVVTSVPGVNVVVQRWWPVPNWPTPSQLLDHMHLRPEVTLDNGKWFLTLLKSGMLAHLTKSQIEYILSISIAQNDLDVGMAMLNTFANGAEPSRFATVRDDWEQFTIPKWYALRTTRSVSLPSVFAPTSKKEEIRHIGIAWDEQTSTWIVLRPCDDTIQETRYTPLRYPLAYIATGIEMKDDDAESVAQYLQQLHFDATFIQQRSQQDRYQFPDQRERLAKQANTILGWTPGHTIGYFQYAPPTPFLPT